MNKKMNKEEMKNRKITITFDELSGKLAKTVCAMNAINPATIIIAEELMDFSAVLLRLLFDKEEGKEDEV